MKKYFSNPLFLPVILLTLVGTFLLLRFNETSKFSQSSKKVLSNFKIEKISKIEIENENKKTQLTRKDGTFFVDQQAEIKADAQAVGEILGVLGKLSQDETASTNKNKWSVFDVSDKAIHVKIEAEKTYEFWIGKNGADYQSSYFRVGSDNNTYLTYQNIRNAFSKQDYRNLTLVDFGSDKIDSLELTYQNSKVLINKENGKWVPDDKSELDSTKTDSLISKVTGLKAKDISSSETAGNPSFSYPYLTIRVKTGASETTVLFGPKSKNGDYMVKTGNSNNIYIVSANNLDSLPKSVRDLQK